MCFPLATLQRTTHDTTPMPHCQNCGSFVTAAYARVFTPNGMEDPRVCPRCEDMVRDGADVRKARSPRQTR